ncbi:uncharacterized protein LOC112898910 isoform X2 [Panicum hallii]|uniref:uncharacterized protein LOC112898910 isoform X2 n=1 Tax=Panicum hallii TaxID=206008 RepID=UPI000DF4EFB2|nr:uncharacterized protein LOC112898910 isoform X2 [Panicum hallii]
MGCFLACFDGDGGRRRRRQKSRRQSPARSPPRSIHVAVVREASDVMVKEVPPPLRGAKPSTLAAAVEVAAADVVVKEEAAPLRGAKPSTLAKAMEVPDEVAGEPPAADVAVTDASSGKELRESVEQKESPLCSLLTEKQATPPLSPVKCSPIVEAIVSPQESVDCSPVVAAVVSTPDSDLREVSEHGSRSSGKKKVTFDMNVTIYENAVLPDQEEEPPEEDEKHVQKAVVLPGNHRYRNCSDSDDDVEDEYAEDDVYGDDSDEEEDDFMDCKIDLVDEEEMITEDDKLESHESLFSLSMSNDQQNDQEAISPAPKSSGTSVDAESPLITRNNLRDRSQCVHPLLNPVQDLSQWKVVKSLKTQAVSGKKLDKENVNLVPDVGARPTRMKHSISGDKEVSVDASLSTWLNSSENSTVDKAQSKSPCSISSVSREERPVLGALTVDDIKQSSSASTPQRSPRSNREEAPILGTVGSYWRCTEQDNEYCSSRSDSGTHGIPNTTSKYREDKRVNWHSTPFNVRLDRAMKKTSA